MAFTSKSPHTCEHCQQITLDLRDNNSITQLSCNVEEAVAADQAGCPLFYAFINSIRKKIRLNDGLATRRNLTFTIRYEIENFPDHPAALVLTVSETLDHENRHVSGHVDIIGHTRLLLWTTGGNAASIDITARPYELDYASPASVQFARSCIESCQLNHEGCRRSTDDIMARQGPTSIDFNSIPSRLLQLVTKDSVLFVKLVGQGLLSTVPKETVSKDGYAILSYCWGGPQPVQLTHDSIDNLGSGIPTSRLPKSLRDAAWFTNEIGLKYLWIDALCIIQDDAEDKIREISRMELYYGQSTVTICAASAAKCSDGFLMSREEDAANYSIGPIRLRAKTASGTIGSVQALDESDNFNIKRPQEPISLRGWTFQEALLSRRILIFSSRHLYFTCTVANAGCGGLEPMLKPRVMTSYESRTVGVNTLSGLRDYPVRNIWDKVVDDYTIRQLGLATDKLPAVSALASSLIPMANERNQKLVYLAGLMIDTTDTDNYFWRTELLWMVHQTQSARPIPNGSPSWSWSSLGGRIITWREPQPGNWSNTDDVQLCKYGVELENEIAPFGAVKGGFVKIRTRTKNLDTITGLKYRITTERDPVTKLVNPDHTVLVLSPDTEERERIIHRGTQGEQRVLLVELIPFYEKIFSPAGLIVTHAPNSDRYVRVGMFEYQQPDYQTAAAVIVRKALFDESRFQDIYII
ncbi:HET-domain-containing protein [Hypoxylon crocopeplum]|nr:HET-domain-containing protein [Hypoxylon crocopeplum]